MTKTKLVTTFTVLLCTLCVCAEPVLSAVTFKVDANNSPEAVTSGGIGNRFVIGTGFGTGSTSLLGATFDVSNSLPGKTFTLNEYPTATYSQTFKFGTITYNEPSLTSGERDNVGVTAVLKLLLPSSLQLSDIAAVATSTSGSGWWKLDFGGWNTANYGYLNTGVIWYDFNFKDSYGNLSSSWKFDCQGESADLYVTVKNKYEPEQPPSQGGFPFPNQHQWPCGVDSLCWV